VQLSESAQHPVPFIPTGAKNKTKSPPLVEDFLLLPALANTQVANIKKFA
jgi:hypothetical protein